MDGANETDVSRSRPDSPKVQTMSSPVYLAGMKCANILTLRKCEEPSLVRTIPEPAVRIWHSFGGLRSSRRRCVGCSNAGCGDDGDGSFMQRSSVCENETNDMLTVVGGDSDECLSIPLAPIHGISFLLARCLLLRSRWGNARGILRDCSSYLAHSAGGGVLGCSDRTTIAG